MKKLILLLTTFTLLLITLSYLNAEIQTLGNFKKGDCIELKQICSNCSYIQITSILSPNTTLIFPNANMTKSGTDYNYSLCNISSSIGKWIVNGKGDLDGSIEAWNFDYEVTITGSSFSTAQGLIYSILLIAVFIMLSLSFYFMVSIPYSNKENLKGQVIKITKLKYIKLFFIGITYVLFLWFLNILVGLSNSYLNLNMFYGFFSFIFQSIIRLSIPFFFVLIIWCGIAIIQDINFERKMRELWGTKF